MIYLAYLCDGPMLKEAFPRPQMGRQGSVKRADYSSRMGKWGLPVKHLIACCGAR